METQLQLFALLVTALSLVVVFLYRYVSRNFNYFEKQGITGPKPSFPFGTWKGAWKKDFGVEDLENVKKYGKIYGTFDGPTPNLIVSDPALIKKLLEDDSDKFQSHRANRVKQVVLHNCLLDIEGKQSEQLKKLLQATFSGGKICKKLFPRISQTAETFVQQLRKFVTTAENDINVSEAVSNYINDTIAFTIFGMDLNGDETVHERFHRAINKAFTVDHPDSLLSLTPFIFESLGSLDNFILRPAAARYLTGLINLVIKDKLKNADVKPEGRAVDLTDLLLAAAEEEKQLIAKEKGVQEENHETLLSNDQLITTCLEVMLAVSRVAKSSLALSIGALASFPQIQEKLHNQLVKQLSTHDELSYEMVQDFDYLDMFVGEILRIYPIEYRLERKCIQQVRLGETEVNPGVVVSVPLYAVHKSSEFYPDPDKFNPERFSPENAEKRNHYTYLPFGQAGTNSTDVGIQLGVLFVKSAILNLVGAFKFTKSEMTQEPPEFVKGITGVPLPKPITIKVEKRE